MIQKSHLISILFCCCIITLALPQNSLEYNSIVTERTFTASERDYWPTEGWRNSTPEEQGMSSADIEGMMNVIVDEDINVHSVMITRHGYIVHEEYLASYHGVDIKHDLHSVTKSFTSSLMGIAIDKGYVDNVSQPILPFFSDYDIVNVDERRERITIENLLTMRSGMFWNETGSSYLSPENDVSYILTGDGVNHSLNLDMVAEPGELWHYNGGASHLLAAIVQSATETSLLDFATENLFDPIGIDDTYWTRDGSGFWYTGAWGLKLTTRSLAKFGYLFLNNGTWDGQQIISEEWVDVATRTFTELHSSQGYGYQWWTNPALDFYYAAGRNGQFIIVVPDQDIVAVFTSGIYSGNTERPLTLFQEFILQNNDVTDMVALQNIVINSVVIAILVIPVVIIGYLRMNTRKYDSIS